MTHLIQSEPQSELFDRWAEVYDTSPNPLLMLEEQSLPPLLPPLAGLHVLDVGCGTGRWLARLGALRPASLVGIDSSTEMLHRARAKLSATACLLQSEADALPVPGDSQDLILCSFVLSYLHDLPAFAVECARALKPGGHLLLSDMHPDTARQRGWTRSFAAEGGTFRIAVHPQLLSDIIDAFTQASFQVSALRAPSFGPEQRSVFEEAGRLEEFVALADVAAIYLLKLRKPLRPQSRAGAGSPARLRLANVKWTASPSIWSDAPISVEEGRIVEENAASRHPHDSLDLSGYVLLPGLINAHDHLEFALFPNLGRSPEIPAYANSTEWARDIHDRHSACIAIHTQIPLETRLWWGAIRNLLCGVTTVCHHNRIYSELRHPDYPVRVVTQLGWAHSLAFEPGLSERFHATPADQPFVLHAGEGTDTTSSRELVQLDRMGLLDHRTVLVHGLAFTPWDVALLNRRGASLILCPTSNHYLFGRTPTNSFLHSIDRIALGSDSPLTAAGDLLNEVRHLRVEQDLDPHSIYNLVTTSPATIFRLMQGEGHILPGGRADLIAVRDTGASPAETLAQSTSADVDLVMVAGRVQLTSSAVYARLSDEQRAGLHPLEAAGMERWVRAPVADLVSSAEQVLGKGNLCVGGKQVSDCDAH